MPLTPALAFLGVAKESSKQTPVSPSAYVPIVATGRKWSDVITVLDDMGSRGAPVDGPFDQVAGIIDGSYEIGTSPAFPDTFPWWMMNILGDYTSLASRSVSDAVTATSTTVTSATAAFTQNDVGRPISGTNIAANSIITAVASATSCTVSIATTGSGSALTITIGASGLVSHVGSAKNSSDFQPGSLTLTDWYGVTTARQWAGCQVEEVAITFNADGLLEYTAKFQGLPSVTVSKPSASWGSVTAPPVWAMKATIAGSANALVEKGTLKIARPTKPIHTVDGIQAPYKIQQAGLNVSGHFDLVMEDDAEYLRYLNSTKPSVVLDLTQGTGSSLTQLRFQMSKTNYKTGVIDPSKPEWTSVQADWQALPDTTDVGASGGFSPINFRAQNTIATGTYA